MRESGEVEVTVESIPEDGAVVRVDGELDLATAPNLEEALETTERGARLVIDLTRCTFLDSSAVRVLMSTARSMSAGGGSLSLVTSDPGLLRVLEIAGVDTMVAVHPTLDSAL